MKRSFEEDLRKRAFLMSSAINLSIMIKIAVLRNVNGVARATQMNQQESDWSFTLKNDKPDLPQLYRDVLSDAWIPEKVNRDNWIRREKGRERERLVRIHTCIKYACNRRYTRSCRRKRRVARWNVLISGAVPFLALMWQTLIYHARPPFAR